MYYCNPRKARFHWAPLSQVLHVVGAEFTTGAKFSRIYGTALSHGVWLGYTSHDLELDR